MPGTETFWLNLVNAAFGITTAAAIVVVVAATIREIVTRGHHSR